MPQKATTGAQKRKARARKDAERDAKRMNLRPIGHFLSSPGKHSIKKKEKLLSCVIRAGKEDGFTVCLT